MCSKLKYLLPVILFCFASPASGELNINPERQNLSNLSYHLYAHAMWPWKWNAYPGTLGAGPGFALRYRFPRARWLLGNLALQYQYGYGSDLPNPHSLLIATTGVRLMLGGDSVLAGLLGLDVGAYLILPPFFDVNALYRVCGGLMFRLNPAWSIGLEAFNSGMNGWDVGPGVTVNVGYHLPSRSASASGGGQVASQNPESLPRVSTVKPDMGEPRAEQTKQEQPPRAEPLTVEPPTMKLTAVAVTGSAFENLFPVFRSFYDTHPVGTITIRNAETVAVSEVVVSFQIKEFMGTAKDCASIPRLGAGETKEVPLLALFSNDILNVTEGAKALAEITITYRLNDKRESIMKTETVRILGRNSMTWDDDRRAAAFVTARDPAVQTFAKNVSSIVKDEGNSAVNQWLSLALGLHEALTQYGLRYAVDPRSSYADFSVKKQSIDFLQFPRETLEFKGGDCDDLSILYCALLEAVGAETAFITVPGHIFMAFSADLSPDEARKAFLRADDLIFRDEKTWIPVEVTERKGGFLQAWQAGAKEWRENLARNQAGFLPVHDAWETYEPVGLPGDTRPVNLPAEAAIKTAYMQEMVKFVNREIFPSVARIQADMKKQGETPRLLNQLGVLYARYGLLDQASVEFKKAATREESIPALMNLGNIAALKGDRDGALVFYERAQKKQPDNPRILLALARVNHEMENYGLVSKLYARLKALDAALAMQHSYLDLKGEEASRAAELGRVKGIVIWED